MFKSPGPLVSLVCSLQRVLFASDRDFHFQVTTAEQKKSGHLMPNSISDQLIERNEISDS